MIRAAVCAALVTGAVYYAGYPGWPAFICGAAAAAVSGIVEIATGRKAR